MFRRLLRLLFAIWFVWGPLTQAASGAENPYEQVAANFLQYKGSPKAILLLEPLEGNDLNPDLPKIRLGYLAHLEDGGYLLVSPATTISPIKAYSFSGDFGSLPPVVRQYLLNELEGRSRAAAGEGTRRPLALSDTEERWNFLLNFQPSRQPLGYTPDTVLLATKWNQGSPYNKFTPRIDGAETWTGCVNTALAQVMKYHRHPAAGQGGESYTWKETTLSAIFSRPYSWEQMPDQIDEATPSHLSDQVAALMSDLGIANHTYYGTSGSGAVLETDALIGNFGYSNTLGSLPNADADSFFAALRNEVDAERPVLLSFVGEHMTVADGYASDPTGRRIHINMGWGGSADNYYYLDQTVNAGGYTFSTDPGKLEINYPIKPCSGGDCAWVSPPAAPVPPVIHTVLPDIALNSTRGEPQRIWIDARDGNGDAVSLGASVSNGAAASVNFDGEILLVTPTSGADRVSTQIVVSATAGGQSVEKSFTALVLQEDVGFGKRFTLRGRFDSQDAPYRHDVILEGSCTIAGSRGWGYGNQAFFTSLIDNAGQTVQPVGNTAIQGDFDRGRYTVTASLRNGSTYYPYTPGSHDTYVIDVSCPSADDSLATIASLLGVDLAPTANIIATAGSNGTISCVPNPVEIGASSTCTVTPDLGYQVDAFTVDGSPAALTDDRYTFAGVMAVHSVNVTFRKIRFAITATAGPHGTIGCTPNPVDYGGNSICSVQPDVGYQAGAFTVDGNPAVLSGNQYVLQNVTAAHAVQVAFRDTTLPVGSITCPGGLYATENPVTVNLSASDAAGVAGVQFSADGVTWGAEEPYATTWSWDIPGGDGPKTIYVRFKDGADNWSLPYSLTLTLDRAAPDLNLSAPPDGSVTTLPTVNVVGTVSDATTGVELMLINGKGVTIQAAFSRPVTLTYGVNTLSVTAVDRAGNVATRQRTVTLDNVNPVLTVTDPDQDIATHAPGMTIRGSVSDLTGIALTVTMDGVSWTPAVTDGSFAQAVAFGAEKRYAVVVTATDAANNSSTVTRNILYDRTAPSVTVDPAATPANGGTRTLTGTREETAEISVTCSTASVGTVSYPTASTWQVTISNLSEGNNPVTIRAADAAGNAVTLETAVVLDSQPPATAAVPAGGTFNAPQNVTLTANEAATIYYTTDGTEPTTASSVYSGPLLMTSMTILKYYAQDAAENRETPQAQTYIFSYPVTVTLEGSGEGSCSVDPGTLLWTGKSGSVAYDRITDVTLTATAEAGSVFSGWTGASCSGRAAVCMVTVDEAKSIGAIFRVGMMGDVDGDGQVTIADTLLAVQGLSGVPLPDPVEIHDTADVDRDGKVGLPEVIYIMQVVAGLRPE
jgi:hypothetical protein